MKWRVIITWRNSDGKAFIDRFKYDHTNNLNVCCAIAASVYELRQSENVETEQIENIVAERIDMDEKTLNMDLPS